MPEQPPPSPSFEDEGRLASRTEDLMSEMIGGPSSDARDVGFAEGGALSPRTIDAISYGGEERIDEKTGHKEQFEWCLVCTHGVFDAQSGEWDAFSPGRTVQRIDKETGEIRVHLASNVPSADVEYLITQLTGSGTFAPLLTVLHLHLLLCLTHAPTGLKTVSYPSSDKDEWFVKVTATDAMLRQGAESMRLQIRLKSGEAAEQQKFSLMDEHSVSAGLAEQVMSPLTAGIEAGTGAVGGDAGKFVGDAAHQAQGAILTSLAVTESLLTMPTRFLRHLLFSATDFAGITPYKEELHAEFEPTHSWHIENSIFNSGERQQIVYHTICAEHRKGGSAVDINDAELGYREWAENRKDATKKGVVNEELLAELDAATRSSPDGVKCIKDAFPLNDAYELEWLKQNWASLKILKANLRHPFKGFTNYESEEHSDHHSQKSGLTMIPFTGLVDQPLEEIRDYYGEEVALYFAFLGTYTAMLSVPGVLGVVTMAGHFMGAGGIDNNPFTMYYSMSMCFWSPLFLKYWKRKESEYRFLWGTEEFEEEQEPRKAFAQSDMTKSELNEFTKELEIILTVKGEKSSHSATVNAVVVTIVFVVAVVVVCLVSMWVKLQDMGCKTQGLCEMVDMEVPNVAAPVGSMLSAVAIVVFGAIWDTVAEKLTDRELHRTEVDYEDSLITKAFIFQFINNFFLLFYTAFLKSGVFDQACLGNSCMKDLEMQLMVVFAIKQFGMQLVEVGVPALKAHTALKKEMKELKKLGMENAVLRTSEKEAKLDDYPGTFLDYNEMAIQFGYCTIFASAFPLAPILALINNAIEIRTDATALTRISKRYQYKAAEDIGAWSPVFEAMSMVSIMTNVLLSSFVGSQVSVGLLGKDPSLTQTERFMEVDIWVFAVSLEHAVLFFRLLIDVQFSNEPDWMENAKLKLHHNLKTRLQTETEREADSFREQLFQKRIVATGGSLTPHQAATKLQNVQRGRQARRQLQQNAPKLSDEERAARHSHYDNIVAGSAISGKKAGVQTLGTQVS